MKTAFKINCLSALYALAFFIQTELHFNIYRIERLIGIGISNVNQLVGIVNLLIIIVSTVVLFLLTKHLMGAKKVKYITSLLWIPYFIILIQLFARLFPITDPQEVPLPGIGLALIGSSILMPFYIALINFTSTLKIRE